MTWSESALRLVASLSPGARRDIENQSPVPLVATNRSMLGGYRTSTEMLAYMDTYGTDSVVHPIVSRLAESVGASEWKLWNKSKTGDDVDRVEVTAHAAIDRLNHPNDFQTRSQLMEAGQQHFELTGETNIVLGMQYGVPLDMWLLRPDRIDPVPDAYKFLKGWIYTAPGTGEKIPLTTAELMRIVHPSPLDPYRGMGAVQALLRDLDAQRFVKEYQAAFFKNNARPGGFLKVDRRLQDDEFTEMSLRWAEQHQGVNKAHRVAILEQADWVENAFSIRDLQISELEGVGRDKALIAFGFPKAALGIVEDVNRANAEAGEYLFAQWLVHPRLRRWRSMFNHHLLPLYKSAGNMEFDFVDPVPENSEARIAELKVKAEVMAMLVPLGFEAPDLLEMLDWPTLSYTAPPPPVIKVPGRLGEEQKAIEQDDVVDAVFAYAQGAGVDMAMRWVVKGHPDSDNTCEPCKKNIGKLYRSRSAAYADYPGGKSYIKCVGEEFGNHCRCSIVKRKAAK